MSLKKWLILLAHAFVLWALCAAVMGVGMALMPLETALVVHAAVAPVIAIAVTSFYYWKFNHSKPLQSAIFFVLFIIIMDAVIVAMVINKSFAMFESFLGTWLPFILIFTASLLTGLLWRKEKK